MKYLFYFFLSLISTALFAADSDVHKAERLLYFVLLQLIVIILAGRLGGLLAKHTGQNAAVGEIIMGILLGPSLLGLLFPTFFQYVFRTSAPEPLAILSQLGLLLLMFQIGMEFNFSHLRADHHRKSVLWVSTASLCFPFATGFAVGYFGAAVLSPGVNQWHSGLFVATAFSITALPILGRILIDLGMTNHPIGVIAISSAAINDVVGWVLLALVTALTTAKFSAASFAVTLLLIFCFFVASWYIVRPLAHKTLDLIEAKTGSEFSDLSLGFLLSLIFLAGLCTYLLGIFAIFGGFMMGVIVHDRERLVAVWRERIGQFVAVFFLPIFFTYTGLRTNIGGLASLELWGLCLMIIALACVAKFFPVLAAARLAGHSQTEAKQLGILMNTRALMELIVINIGYDLKVISQNLFTMLVLMAIVSTVITTPLMRRWLQVDNVDNI